MSGKNVLFVGGPWHGDARVMHEEACEAFAPVPARPLVLDSVPVYASLVQVRYLDTGWRRGRVELWTVDGIEPWMAVR